MSETTPDTGHPPGQTEQTETPEPTGEGVSSSPPLLLEPALQRSPDAAIRALGFDPARIRSLVLTPTSAVAVAADYPDPHTMQEVPDAIA